MSEREPELGLGVVAHVDRGAKRISIEFPATHEKRLYALGTPVLKRVQFREGESLATREGVSFVVESVEDNGGLLTYIGGGKRVSEATISDVTSVASPPSRLMAGQADDCEVFDLRYRALMAQEKFRKSEVRGFLGGRLDLIPHQFYILQEVASRQLPRVLLADEVGLGKTIEACLIIQRLLAVGKAKRVLILVPESLIHQWFVELLRRFNLWFSIFDEARCIACEASDPQQNPFLSSQLALASVDFLTGNPTRTEQIVAAGWDVVVVDEAHHLAWSPTEVSPGYALVEQLAARSAGLLLLTATPTQLGAAGHFARLRLLDPARYADYDVYLKESESYGAIAGIAEKIIDEAKLTKADHSTLKKIFNKDPDRLESHLEDLASGKAGAREALIKTLLDQHGPGRVVFRNTRAAMTGFPKRRYAPVELPAEDSALLVRVARELRAEESGEADSIRYSFKDDPRIDWLVEMLANVKPAKVLLICKTQRKVLALEAALQEKTAVKTGLFHEGLPLVQRDRQAAWFAEPDGAQLLICSEIGSEGRNFQFAHHLVLFDLPLNPGLVEQRIGRLDRIGQTDTINIHVPLIAGSADACVADWYHRGLDAFETSLLSGNDYEEKFKTRLLELAVATGEAAEGAKAATRRKAAKKEFEAFIAETTEFRTALSLKLKQGRDRLLELASFDRATADRVIAKVREADADPFVRSFLLGLLDHFGVRLKEHEDGDVFLDANHAYVEGFPSIPKDGMLATFDRRRAIAREDIRFLSADHSLVRDSIDLLIASPAGTTAFAVIDSDTPNLLLETVFVLETVADSKWHVDQFLAPTPVRIVVDVRGRNLTATRGAIEVSADCEDGELTRFLERPGFNAAILKSLVDGSTDLAGVSSKQIRMAAEEAAKVALGADVERLEALQKLNDHVRPEEIALAREQLKRVCSAIQQARLRLDSLRLIMEGPVDAFRKGG